MEKLQTKMISRRLLLVPLPLQGHITPMLQLAEILSSKGFSITIIQTNLNSLDPHKYPKFTFRTIISDGPEAPGGHVLNLIAHLNSNYLVPFERALSELLKQNPVSCLISDAFLYFTRAVAERFDLPRFVLRTSGISSFRAFASFSFLAEKGYLNLRDSRPEEEIEDFSPFRMKDLPVFFAANPGLQTEVITRMLQETKASAGLIWNSFEELEQPALEIMKELFSIPIFPIGPFHKYFTGFTSSLVPQDRNCIPWLDTRVSKSVIYASFGSLIEVEPEELIEVAYGLANSKCPFLLVIRPGLMRGDGDLPLPDDLSEKIRGQGMIVEWAPQLDVLAHRAVGAFLTHSGWNSTMESICEGVPMICMPRLTDQLGNARYVSHVWKVGVSLDLENVDRVNVELAVRKVMEEDEGEAIRKRASELKEKASLCLKPGGSSYEALQKLVACIPPP